MNTLKRLGRPLLIGFVGALMLWLVLMMTLGIRMTKADTDGAFAVGVGPIELAAGSQLGDRRSAGLEPLGFVVVLAVLATPSIITVARSGRAHLETAV